MSILNKVGKDSTAFRIVANDFSGIASMPSTPTSMSDCSLPVPSTREPKKNKWCFSRSRLSTAIHAKSFGNDSLSRSGNLTMPPVYHYFTFFQQNSTECVFVELLQSRSRRANCPSDIGIHFLPSAS